jgi:WD40 repeat protein
MFGRFLATLLVAGALCFGVAWYFKLFDSDHLQDPKGQAPGGSAQLDLGGPLYKATAGTPARPINDEPPLPKGARRPYRVVMHDGHLVVFEKQDVCSDKDGLVLFIGEQAHEEDPTTAKSLPSVPLFVGDSTRFLAYRPWKEGDPVMYGQMLGLVNPVKAINDRLYKKARIVAAQAEYQAAVATAKEAHARVVRLDQIRTSGGARVVSEEDYSAAVLTRVRYEQETVGKEQAVKLAIIEAGQAEAEYRQHEIRNLIPGKSYIKTIYKTPGEGIKNQEPVMQLYSTARLRVEGAVEVGEVLQLREAMRAHGGQKGFGLNVIVEPTQDLSPLPLPKAHTSEITGVAVSHDPKQPANPRFVSAGEDGKICVWRRHEERPYKMLDHSAAVRAVACSPPQASRRWCAAGCADGSIYLWDLDGLDKGQPVHQIRDCHNAAVSALAFSPDGRWLASGGQDNLIYLWDAEAGKLQYAFDHEHGVDNPHRGTITALHFTPQCKLVSAARDNTLRVWELHEKGARLAGKPLPNRTGNVLNPGVSADGRLMAFDQGRNLMLYSVDEQMIQCGLQNPPTATPFETLALFSPDASLLLTAGGTEGRMQLWRAPTPMSRGYELRQLASRERSPVSCAAFAPDGSFVVSGGKDGLLHLWVMPSREVLQKHRIHHRIQFDEEGRPVKQGQDAQGRAFTQGHIDQAVEAGKVRATVEVQNPETQEYPRGRLIPGGRVTVVLEF